MFLDPEWIAKQRAQIPSETNRIKAAVRMTGCFVGKLNPNYKTGFHVLRREIRERANGICELCKKGHKGLKGFLDIHHLDRNPENNSIDNTKMICPNCHRLEHIRMKNNE
jgi:5-methylcytosine-specific restriction endonuclease McrA